MTSGSSDQATREPSMTGLPGFPVSVTSVTSVVHSGLVLSPRITGALSKCRLKFLSRPTSTTTPTGSLWASDSRRLPSVPKALSSSAKVSDSDRNAGLMRQPMRRRQAGDAVRCLLAADCAWKADVPAGVLRPTGTKDGGGSSPRSLSRTGIRRHRGCQFPDAILHGKRSLRPHSRAVQRLTRAGFRVRPLGSFGLMVAPPAREPGQDTAAILSPRLDPLLRVGHRLWRCVGPKPRV